MQLITTVRLKLQLIALSSAKSDSSGDGLIYFGKNNSRPRAVDHRPFVYRSAATGAHVRVLVQTQGQGPRWGPSRRLASHPNAYDMGGIVAMRRELMPKRTLSAAVRQVRPRLRYRAHEHNSRDENLQL